MINITLANKNVHKLSELEQSFKMIPNIFVPYTAVNQSDLLHKLKSVQPEILFLDYTLAEDTSKNLCQFISKSYPYVKIVLLVDDLMNLDDFSLWPKGFSGYMLKNADTQKLNQVIQIVHQNQIYIEEKQIRHK